MHSVVFRRGNYLQVTRIVTLQTFDECDSQTRSQIRILAVGFLTTTPARIAKDVDIGTPKSEPFVTGALVMTLELVMFGTRLGRDDIGKLEHKIRVTSRSQPDG